MADEKKPKKSKKKEKVEGAEEGAAPPAPAEGEAPPAEASPAEAAAEEEAPPAPRPALTPVVQVEDEEAEVETTIVAKLPSKKSSSKRPSTRDSKRAQRSTSNVFDHFSQSEVEDFKAGFQFIDMDKDGIISKSDLRACLDSIGNISNEKELDSMIAEASGPINFTQMLTLFFHKMTSGIQDDNVTIFNAFSCYKQDPQGRCDADKFRDILFSGDDRFSDEEADACFELFDVEDGKVNIDAIIAMLTGEGEGEEA
jgi:Ca2+-binding EF-hand superfamily protein